MTPITSKKWQKAPSPKSINLSNRLFVEADQLSEAAYALLSDQPISAQTIHEFAELKRRADEKYLEARQEWLNTKDKIR
jgi:hypothetical protein